MINLSSYVAIESAIFVKWEIPSVSPICISDYNSNVSFGGDTYYNLGTLMNVSTFNTELRASAAELSVTLSGVPTNTLPNYLSYEIKGSEIEIYRGIFDPETHTLLNLSPSSNPVLKFKGIVTNFSISDEVNVLDGVAVTTVVLTCNSEVELLSNKISGRRTNPRDFPGENSMDRVSALANSNFQFGADT